MYNLVGSYTGQNSQTLTFDSSKTYFGMWWSAGDPANQLVFYDGATILASYSTADIIPFLSSAYYGNPNNGLNPNEPYVYLNFTTTGASRITSIEFNCDLFAGFESDNHSVHDQVIEPPGNTLPTVPATGSTLTMLLMGVCFITLVGAKLTGDRVFRHV